MEAARACLVALAVAAVLLEGDAAAAQIRAWTGGGSSILRLPSPCGGHGQQPNLRSLYRCKSIFNNSCRTYITDACGRACPTCDNQMAVAAQYLLPAGQQVMASAGFVQGVVMYTVMDDLTVRPMSAISSFTLLNAFAVTDLAAL